MVLRDAISIPANMQLPVPPQNGDVGELNAYILSLHYLLTNLLLTGLQITMFTQAEMDEMAAANELKQVGKIFYDTSNDKFYRAKNSGGTLVIEEW